ncbi:hypothetical protein [Streptomyces lincolnensis]|nr:hypothetical protein [Streptomyces lincolnensis]
MNVIENVASGLLVALIIWGTRRAGLHWRRRRPRRAPDHEAADI